MRNGPPCSYQDIFMIMVVCGVVKGKLGIRTVQVVLVTIKILLSVHFS